MASVDSGYRQDCIRHLFCSYALAVGWSLADVIAYMGHSGFARDDLLALPKRGVGGGRQEVVRDRAVTPGFWFLPGRRCDGLRRWIRRVVGSLNASKHNSSASDLLWKALPVRLKLQETT